MITLTKQNILQLLKTEECGVFITFNKKDGTERQMLCTRREPLMERLGWEGFPKKKTPFRTMAKNEYELIRVWSTVDKAWRTIIKSSILDVRPATDDGISW